MWGLRSSILCNVGTLLAWFGIVTGLTSNRAGADVFDEYAPLSSVVLPSGTDVFDIQPDGRLLVLVNSTVFLESETASGTFLPAGVLPGAGSLDFPAFLRVSPDGSRFAVGDGFSLVGVFSFPALAGTWFTASHYDGEWWDQTRLALSGSGSGAVTLLDTTSPNPAAPLNPVLIQNTGVAAGIAFDSAGNLFTGNGFGTLPFLTGEVRAFPHVDWKAVLGGGSPLDFLSDGILIVDVLSAASLGFDAEGNLHVGGGDLFGGGKAGFVALVRANVVAAALSEDGPADINNPEEVRRLDPDPQNTSEFYSVTYGTGTGRLYIQDFGSANAHVFGVPEPAPAISGASAVLMGMLLTWCGRVILVRGNCPPGRQGSIAHGSGVA